MHCTNTDGYVTNNCKIIDFIIQESDENQSLSSHGSNNHTGSTHHNAIWQIIVWLHCMCVWYCGLDSTLLDLPFHFIETTDVLESWNRWPMKTLKSSLRLFWVKFNLDFAQSSLWHQQNRFGCHGYIYFFK